MSIWVLTPPIFYPRIRICTRVIILGKVKMKKKESQYNGAFSTMGNSDSTTMEPSMKTLQNYQFRKDENILWLAWVILGGINSLISSLCITSKQVPWHQRSPWGRVWDIRSTAKVSAVRLQRHRAGCPTGHHEE